MTNVDNPENYCKSLIKSFSEKATHNKKESMYCFWISMGGALIAPIFVTLGDGIANLICGSIFFFSKLLPTVLTISVAFSTAWLQLRKPQQLWALYRTSQRELENILTEFTYRINDFNEISDDNARKLLVEKSSKIALSAHYSWLPMVPNPENINTPKKEEQ